MAPSLNLGSIATALAVVLAGLLFRFLAILYNHRRRMRDLPKPPWHPILGNLPTLGKATAAFPPRAHPHCTRNPDYGAIIFGDMN
ncbi:MAG: hypothetical protein Q9222_002256 [Ikaeria aurantiellina]